LLIAAVWRYSRHYGKPTCPVGMFSGARPRAVVEYARALSSSSPPTRAALRQGLPREPLLRLQRRNSIRRTSTSAVQSPTPDTAAVVVSMRWQHLRQPTAPPRDCPLAINKGRGSARHLRAIHLLRSPLRRATHVRPPPHRSRCASAHPRRPRGQRPLGQRQP